MKQTFIIILLSIIGIQISHGQKTLNWTDVDTLQVYTDKVLVNFRTYSNSNLISNGQSFLYPCMIEVRKSKWLPRFFKTIVSADSVVLHGIVQSQWDDGKYRIGKYENGQVIEMTYYNSSNKIISRQEFYKNLRISWDVEQGINLFIIHGTKEKKE